MTSVAVWAVVPAAGAGKRMQSAVPKQYLALAGEPVTPDATRQQLLSELRTARARRQKAMRPFDTLAQREAETLAALGRGTPAATIAEEWVVSMATVRSHIRSVLVKLGVSSQLEAVAMAHRVGWFQPMGGESPILMMTVEADPPTMRMRTSFSAFGPNVDSSGVRKPCSLTLKTTPSLAQFGCSPKYP